MIDSILVFECCAYVTLVLQLHVQLYMYTFVAVHITLYVTYAIVCFIHTGGSVDGEGKGEREPGTPREGNKSCYVHVCLCSICLHLFVYYSILLLVQLAEVTDEAGALRDQLNQLKVSDMISIVLYNGNLKMV